jgi:hypothetical protein
MQATKVYPTWAFWILAFTFAWGFLIAPVGIRKFIGWREWSTVWGYPIVCWVAAILLARAKRKGSAVFAWVHVAFGIGWVIFAIWAFRAFASNFWR